MYTADPPLLLKFAVSVGLGNVYRLTLRRAQPVFRGDPKAFRRFRDKVKFLIRENPEDSDEQVLQDQVRALGDAMVKCIVQVEETPSRRRVHVRENLKDTEGRIDLKPVPQSAIARAMAFSANLFRMRVKQSNATVLPKESYQQLVSRAWNANDEGTIENGNQKFPARDLQSRDALPQRREAVNKIIQHQWSESPETLKATHELLEEQLRCRMRIGSHPKLDLKSQGNAAGDTLL